VRYIIHTLTGAKVNIDKYKCSNCGISGHPGISGITYFNSWIPGNEKGGRKWIPYAQLGALFFNVDWGFSRPTVL